MSVASVLSARAWRNSLAFLRPKAAQASPMFFHTLHICGWRARKHAQDELDRNTCVPSCRVLFREEFRGSFDSWADFYSHEKKTRSRNCAVAAVESLRFPCIGPRSRVSPTLCDQLVSVVSWSPEQGRLCADVTGEHRTRFICAQRFMEHAT